MEEETMKDRREFLKSLVALGCMAPLGMADDPNGIPVVHPGGQVSVVVPIPDVPWRRRIFCQFDPRQHKALLIALQRCADETGCDIVFGEKDSPDLYAIGGFVLVLDRSQVGDEEWRNYVEMYREDSDITPCFIIDRRTDLALPNWRFTYRLDMADPGSVPTIADAIRQMKMEMNRRLPDMFKKTGGERQGNRELF